MKSGGGGTLCFSGRVSDWGAENAVKDTTGGLSPEAMKDIQEFAKALKAAVAAACDELIAAAEAARAAYMAAHQEAEPTIDAIMALFGEMEDAGEPQQRGGGYSLPPPVSPPVAHRAAAWRQMPGAVHQEYSSTRPIHNQAIPEPEKAIGPRRGRRP